MGLASEFKLFVRSHLPEAIVDAQPADICVIDSMCSLRGFVPDCDPEISTRPLDALVSRIVDAASSGAPGVSNTKPKTHLLDFHNAGCTHLLDFHNAGCTLLVVFDRQLSTTRMKENEQAKRNVKRQKVEVSKKIWTVEETDAMLARRELPAGSEWGDLLDNREMRGRVVEALASTMFARFQASEGVMERVNKLIVVNGRIGADLERGYGPRAQTADREDPECRDVDIDEAPWSGEADIAMARWIRILRKDQHPRISVHTVDTDIVPICMIHGGENCTVHLSSPLPQHRMRISTYALGQAFYRMYGLRPEEAVVVAISKKTDFTKVCQC